MVPSFVDGFSDNIESINKTADKARGIIMASSHTGPIYNRLSQLKKGTKIFIRLVLRTFFASCGLRFWSIEKQKTTKHMVTFSKGPKTFWIAIGLNPAAFKRCSISGSS